jgi:succinoglycan biosynthesis protein ExoM
MRSLRKLRHTGILITTFRRPKGLMRCLKSIVDQRGQYGSFEIHIIDNDCDPVVEGMVIEFKQETRSQLYYHKEPKRGVASARNGALAVVSDTMDYVAFIDDDEIASPFWLESMLTTAEQFSASIVQGPVEPQFEDPVPGWFRNSRITALGPFREGEELRFGFSGNVLLSRSLIQESGLRFDLRFDKSGGEDQHYFMSLMKNGHRIIASRDAIVFETIPRSRMLFKEYVKRRFRIGATLTLSWRLLRTDKLVAPYRVLIGSGHAISGFISCFSPWCWRFDLLALSIGRIAYGIGQIAGTGGFVGSSYTTIHQSRLDRAGDPNHG